MKIRKSLLTGAALCGIIFGSSAAHAVKINFDFDFDGVDPLLAANAQAGFEAAAAQWENLLKDKITVNISAGFADLGSPNVIAQAGSNAVSISYAAIRNALQIDAKGDNDAVAVANLFPGDALPFFTNTLGTLDGGPDINDDTNPADNLFVGDNLFMAINTANAKALGFNVGDVEDAAITFNTIFPFDFDRTDGIEGGQIDFVGVAMHEIGHALGFVSGVDTADFFSGVGPGAEGLRDIIEAAGLDRDAFADLSWLDVAALAFGIPDSAGLAIYSPLDLFRYSDLSFDENGNFLGFDFTTGLGREGPLVNADLFNLPDNSNPFFSIDGGLTNIAPFSTGSFNGIPFELLFGGNTDPTVLSNFQASHFLETFGAQNPAIGIMEAAFGRGEFGLISAADILAFDAIGYDLIPEPAAIALFGFGLLGFGALRRRRRA